MRAPNKKCTVYIDDKTQAEVEFSHYEIEHDRLILFNEDEVVAVFNKWNAFLAVKAVQRAEKIPLPPKPDPTWLKPVIGV